MKNFGVKLPYVVASLLAVFGTAAAGWAQGEAITFSVTGDVPYRESEVALFQDIVDSHNLYSPSEFLVHVGDIKSGGGSCGEHHYQRLAAILKSLEVPRFSLIGDNEWTDCSNEDRAFDFWQTHLLDLQNNTLCNAPAVVRHPVRQELFAFVKKGVLFIAINIVGGGNEDRILEYNVDWLREQFQSRGPEVRAAVIFAHADPTGSFEDEFPSAAISFGKPILYIQGNDHVWRLDDGYLANNVTRVVVDRGEEPPVQVTVTLDNRNNASTFLFERDPWPVGTEPIERTPCGEDGGPPPVVVIIDSTFTPTDDTFVRSDDPTRNHGGSEELRVRLSRVDYDTYLKFNVVGLTGQVVSAKLRLHVLNGGDDGGELYLVSNEYDGTAIPWDEFGLNWTNAPALTGGPLVHVGRVNAGETVELDVTSAISGGGVYSFALSNVSSNAVSYSSNNTTFAPELVVAWAVSSHWITSFNPASGVAGTEVTVTGLKFTDATDVSFGGTPAGSFTVDSDTQLRAQVPSVATTGKIRVTTLAGSVNSSDDFIVVVRPVISSFSPNRGPVGTEVTVQGSGLTGVTEVAFNGLIASDFSIDSDTQLRARVPTAASTGEIRLTNAAGTGSSQTHFVVTQVPSIAFFDPSLAAIGAEVTVTGANFTGTTSISFNTTPASNFSIESDSELRVYVPENATTGKISITNNIGTGTSSRDFKVILAPTISSFTPPRGSFGTEVTISGSHFTGVTDVTFGGVSTFNVEVDSDAELRAEVPTGAITGEIIVINPAGTAASETDFRVLPPASRVVIQPTHDTFVRSNDVTRNDGDSDELRVRLSSGDFNSYLKFNVGGLSGVVNSATLRLYAIDGSSDGGELYRVSNDYLGTTTPWEELGLTWNNAPPLTGSPLGSAGKVSLGDTIEFDLTQVVQSNGTYSFVLTNISSDAVRYSAKEGSVAPELVLTQQTSELPAISAFTPLSGSAGTEVTLTGVNFVGATEVRVGATPVSDFTVDSDIQLRLRLPDGATTGPILVVTSLGAGQSSEDFIVNGPTVIHSFAPEGGSVGTEVTVLGEGFESVTTVSFNNTNAPSFTIDSDTRLRVIVPPGGQTGTIRLTSPSGTAVSSSDFLVTGPPEINSFRPDAGGIGAEVTVIGKHFSGTIEVSVNNVPDSSFTVQSDTLLHFRVPVGATTGKITIKNAEGTSESRNEFEVVFPPTIASFTPARGPEGTEVTILGTGFTHATDVSFGGVSSSNLRIISDDKIRATVPDGAASGEIQLSNLAGTATSTSGFTVLFLPQPRGFRPAFGVVGTEVTVSGRNLGGTTAVTFNDTVAANFRVMSDTALVTEVPAGATTGKISVTTPHGSAESPSEFTVVLPPTIHSFRPTSGPAGMEVTLTGSHCRSVKEVLFNGYGANFFIDSDTQIRAHVPSGATKGKITIINIAGRAFSESEFDVTVSPSSAIFEVTDDTFVRSDRPYNNYGGEAYIHAKHSATSERYSYLKFDVTGLSGPIYSAKVRAVIADPSPSGGIIYLVANTYSASNTPWDENGLNWANAPALSGEALSSVGAVSAGDTVEFDVTSAISGNGTYSFGLRNADVNRVKYVAKEGGFAARLILDSFASRNPFISSFQPAAGVQGSEVTLQGFNLAATSAVAFNGVKAGGFNVDSDRQLRVLVPTPATSGKISVTTPDGTTQSTEDFRIIQAPVVTSVTPETAPIGTEITIAGNNFIGITAVTFGETDASTFTAASDTQILAQVPTGAADGAISVTNVAGTGTSNTSFSIAFVPAVTGFDPTRGPVGTEVTITGNNFSGVTAVTFAGRRASRVAVDSETQIRVVVADSSTTGPIAATNADGTGMSSENFFVIEPPTIASFTPEDGPGGTEVTITGNNFEDLSEVTFNAVSASDFTVLSPTQLRVTVPHNTTTGAIEITNSAGTATSVTVFTVVQLPQVTFNPTDDTFVRSSSPNADYSRDSELIVRKSSVRFTSYLKFNVSGISGTVYRATIRLRVTDPGPEGGEIYSVSNNYAGSGVPWAEAGLGWGNAPPISGKPLGVLNAATAGSVVEFDVTDVISGDGVYSFALRNNSNDAAKYSSNEGSNPPQLVIALSPASSALSKVNESPTRSDHKESLASDDLPERLSIVSAYPNPFNLEMSIDYAVPQTARVRLVIYNIRGRQIRVLVDEQQEAGYRKARWDGRNAQGGETSSGMYIIQLEMANQRQTRAITLLK